MNKYMVILILIGLTLIPISSAKIYINGSNSGNSFNMEIPDTESGYAYVIYQPWYLSGYAAAKNGTTGKIDYLSTNHTLVFDNAISALINGGSILVKSGTYNVNIDISKNNISIFGEGLSSVLKLNNINWYVINIMPYVNNTTISNFHFLGGTDFGATQPTIHAGGCNGCPMYYNYDIIIKDNYFENGKTRAIDIYDSYIGTNNLNYNIIVRNNIFKNMTLDAIFISANNVIVDGNIIYDSPDTAIDTSAYGKNYTIVNNQIYSANVGILHSDTNGSSIISNNILRGITANGIGVSKTANTINNNFIISNNYIEGYSGQTGITASNVSNVSITGNTIYGFGAQQLSCANGANSVSIIGNSFFHPTTNFQVNINTCTNVSIIGNYFDTGGQSNGGITTNRRITIIGNTFNNPDTSVILSTTSSNYSVIMNNVHFRARAGFSIVNSGYNIIKNNIFINSIYNNDIIESGTSNYNIIQGNELGISASLTITGSDTIYNQNYNSSQGGYNFGNRSSAPTAFGVSDEYFNGTSLNKCYSTASGSTSWQNATGDTVVC